MSVEILTAALSAYDAGLCVIRARTDGSKAPKRVPGRGKVDPSTGRRRAGWELFQAERPDRATVEAWFTNGHAGMGIVCGAVSDNVEMLELEGRSLREGLTVELVKQARAAGLADVLKRVTNGYYEDTPSGGRHLYYRVDGEPVPGNLKLARRPATEAELAERPDDAVKTLIETRGEGGFSVTAPSNGATHPTGIPWTVRAGALTSIATITTAERDALLEVCRSFDRMPQHVPAPIEPAGRTTVAPFGGGPVRESWMDAVETHLAATLTMRTVLEQYGWEHCYNDAHGRQLMRRPGKDDGVSASINANGRLYVWSTSTPFEIGPTTHGLLDVLAVYEHRGDRQAAGRAIAEQTGILAAWKSERDSRALSELTPPASVAPTGIDAETGEITSPNLPEEFWRARPRLAHVRQAAHSRTRSADAVLGGVLARVAMLTPPTIVLPAITGDTGTVDLIVGLVAHPGGGKSTAVAISRRLVPTERTDIVDGIPLGSGEGLVDKYLGDVQEIGDDGKKKRVRRQVMTSVLAMVDEGQVLAELGSRRGSTLLATLRTAWSGGDLGQANASVETHRHVRAGHYRFAAIVAWQPSHAAAILADDTSGTPQRILWLPGSDPSIPDEPPPWPGPLDWGPPATITGGIELEVDRDVADEIRRRQLARARGLERVDPLAAHDDLAQLKVAGVLAVFDDRADITAEDWALADMVMRTSRRVRASIVAAAAAEAERRDQANIGRAIRRETAIADTVERRAFVSATRSVGRRAHRSGTDEVLSRRDLARAIAGKHREVVDVDDVIAAAAAEGWIEQAGDTFRPGRSKPT